jgi:hypothetical protein
MSIDMINELSVESLEKLDLNLVQKQDLIQSIIHWHNFSNELINLCIALGIIGFIFLIIAIAFNIRS